jgi:hypothetical protein
MYDLVQRSALDTVQVIIKEVSKVQETANSVLAIEMQEQLINIAQESSGKFIILFCFIFYSTLLLCEVRNIGQAYERSDIGAYNLDIYCKLCMSNNCQLTMNMSKVPCYQPTRHRKSSSMNNLYSFLNIANHLAEHERHQQYRQKRRRGSTDKMEKLRSKV